MSELTTLFGNIADAIRAKNGTSDNIQALNFPTAISQLGGAEFGHSAGTVSKDPSNSATYNCVTIPDLIGKKNVAIIFDSPSKFNPSVLTAIGGTYIDGSTANYVIYVTVDGGVFTQTGGSWNSTIGRYKVNPGRELKAGNYYWIAW